MLTCTASLPPPRTAGDTDLETVLTVLWAKLSAPERVCVLRGITESECNIETLRAKVPSGIM